MYYRLSIINILVKRDCFLWLDLFVLWLNLFGTNISIVKFWSKHRAASTASTKVKKPIIARNILGALTELREPNKEIQMDFAGPIPFKNSTQNNYILVTVDRLSRFPHAETFNNCDTNTAIEYLESYCKLHEIPRSIKFDQAQAFKSEEFELFCKNKNIKLIRAPAGDHRGTVMVEYLTQTIKSG